MPRTGSGRDLRIGTLQARLPHPGRGTAEGQRESRSEGRILVGETDSCTRSTASAARSLAWSTSPSGAVDPNTVYVITPLFKTSSTTSHVPGKRPWILTPGSGTACTHRISDEFGVINTRQTFGSGDTACGILTWATRNVFDPAEP